MFSRRSQTSRLRHPIFRRFPAGVGGFFFSARLLFFVTMSPENLARMFGELSNITDHELSDLCSV
jgi:hypothetical protein